MTQIRQGGMIFNVDSQKNPIVERIVVKEIIAVPDTATPETSRETAVISSKDKRNIDIFNQSSQITLTGQWRLLGSFVFDKSDFEDAVTITTYKVKYIVETDTNSQGELQLRNLTGNATIAGSTMDTGVFNGKKSMESGVLTMPATPSIIECWGKKTSGSINYLAARLNVERTK